MRENKTRTTANLHLLQEPRQGLQPGHGLDVLLRVHDPELGTELGDDRSSAPAVLEGQIRQIAVDVVTKIQYFGSSPSSELQKFIQIALLVNLAFLQLVDFIPE